MKIDTWSQELIWLFALPEEICSQFHQHFTLVIRYTKVLCEAFSNYSLALLFFGAKITAQKLLVKC
jgi:hypothetical protein